MPIRAGEVILPQLLAEWIRDVAENRRSVSAEVAARGPDYVVIQLQRRTTPGEEAEEELHPGADHGVCGTVFLDSDGRAVYDTAYYYATANAPKPPNAYRSAFDDLFKLREAGQRTLDNRFQPVLFAILGIVLLAWLACS